MRKAFLPLLSLSLLAAVAGWVHAASGEVQGEVDMDLMQTIEDTHKSLASNIALKQAQPSVTDAAELARLFVTVESHFLKKGDAADAVALSKKSRELATDIVTLVNARNFDAANDASTALGRACRECHTFYKKS